MADVRHNLATPKLLGKSVQDGKMSLSDLLDTLNQAVVDQVKAALHHLQVCLLILMSHSQCLIISVYIIQVAHQIVQNTGLYHVYNVYVGKS